LEKREEASAWSSTIRTALRRLSKTKDLTCEILEEKPDAGKKKSEGPGPTPKKEIDPTSLSGKGVEPVERGSNAGV